MYRYIPMPDLFFMNQMRDNLTCNTLVKYLVIILLMIYVLICIDSGDFVCEDLPTNVCAFAISTSGKRCLLENSAGRNGKVEYQCKTSNVVVTKMKEHIETDECVDRNSVGISSDALLEPQFAAKLCSPACYKNCDSIVDLYFHLAAGEVRLLDMNQALLIIFARVMQKQKNGPHRTMIELSSNGAADEDAAAPAPN
ncbi:hypothetical protein H5410_053051 [Solanum commersonii]|uniref:PAR1 protein n=1 Tax=Solanum commersonii TaxID=4109 RepID=A0A9J5X5Y8_SOLCO|nr:hypothetical protein H5410_053051 [Solanum commersonii]